MSKLISIIVNVYNSEKYIKKCLDSIINQTYKNLEILIINDGSTDDTLSICKSYDDKRIRIINQKNMGISLSRNVGINNFKGEYVFFVDSDDYIEPDTIEYLYNLCEEYNLEMSICRSKEVFDYENKIINKEEKVEIISGLDLVKKMLLNLERNGNIWGKLMKKDLIKKVKFQDRIMDDVPVVYKIALPLKKIAYSNQMKYYYYRHPNSILTSRDLSYSIDCYKSMIERYDYLKKLYPNMIENDICILWVIVILYGHNNEKLNEYLDKEKAKKLFKKRFTIRVIGSKLKRKDKIKIILFRISPKLYSFIIRNYMKTK